MRWLDNDPNGSIYWNRNLTAYGEGRDFGTKQKKWNMLDFGSKGIEKSKGDQVFNYHFQNAGTARMTKLELSYLHSLIEELKQTGVNSYRKLEIWRALNWAPVSEQFAYVLPSQKDLQKYSEDFTIKIADYTASTYKGFWVEQFTETLMNTDDKIIIDNCDITPEKPSHQKYPFYYESKLRAPVPSFVLKRVPGEWLTGMYVTESDGKRSKNNFIKNEKDIRNPLLNPFKTNENGEIISIGNLDNIIKAKMAGWKINGQIIPDQEIVHYIRRKYGFAHAVDHSYNKDSGLPQAHWYVIPFYDDEPDKCLNLGAYVQSETPGKLDLVDKDMTLFKQDRIFITGATLNVSSLNKGLDYPGGFDFEWLTNLLLAKQPRDYSIFYFDFIKITNSLLSKTINYYREKKISGNYIQTWNQIFYFSTIRAYWRAACILDEIFRYTHYIEKGLESKKVIAVAGQITPVKNTEDYDDALNDMSGMPNQNIKREPETSLFFISGEKTGKTPYGKYDHHDDDSRVSARRDIEHKVIHDDNYSERSWNSIFSYTTKGGKNSFATDREIRIKGQCNKSTQYLRNILLPKISPYVSNILYDEKQIKYTKKALDNMALLYKPYWQSQFSNLNGTLLNQFEKKAVQSILTGVLDPKQYTEFAKLLKYNKSAVFVGSMFTIIVVELAGAAFHSFHTTAANIAHTVEGLLIGYKFTSNSITGNYFDATRDLVVGLAGLYLTSSNTFIGIGRVGFTLTTGWATIVSVAVTISIYIWDRIHYSKDKQKEVDDLLKLFNEASDLNLLEGPYGQTKGIVQIRKGPNGSLPIGFKVSSDGKTYINEYENFQNTGQINDGKETKEQRIERLNKEFLEPKSKWETKFFNQLEKIECKTLLDIAKKTTQSNSSFNPVLNQAPNHLDVGLFKVKESGQYEGVNGEKILKNLELYFYIAANDVKNIEQDYVSMDKSGKFELLQRSGERPRIIGSKFRYITKQVDLTTNLEKYIQSKEVPSEFKVAVDTNNLITSNRYQPTGKGTPTYFWDDSGIADKEKVWLIRKKYGLDEVLPDGNCCGVFDVPPPNFIIESNCQYLYDFTSRAFIKKLEEFCGKKEEEDKNKENEKLIKAILGDQKIATTHGQTEEKRVQHAIKMDESRKQDDRRNKKRNTSGYQGTPDSIQNLAQAPRLGVQALIPGNISYDLPITDSESQQRIAFETLDTERDKTSSLIANLVINLVGTLVRKSISESLYPSRNPPSKPSETQGTLPETQVIAEKPFVLVSDGGIVYAQYYEPSTSKRLHRVPYSPKKK